MEATTTHVRGEVLLAIAEGIAEKQPDDATLGHVFSCEQCAGNLREMRRGLLGLTSDPAAPAPMDLADAADPLDPEAIAASVDLKDDVADRSRSMLWKVALMGVALAGALYYMRSLASSFGR